MVHTDHIYPTGSETKLAPAYDTCVTLYDILTYALSAPIIPNLVVGPYKRPVAILPRVKEYGISYGQSIPGLVTPFYLKDVLQGSAAKAECVPYYYSCV